MGEDSRAIDDLDALVGRFLACTLPKAEWTHRAHLAVGAWHVDRYGADDAIERLRRGIRALNDSHGTVNSATSGYHETITCAYARVIGAFLADCEANEPLTQRAARLVDGPLGERDALLRYYTRETLMSPRARLERVEPDLRAFDV